MFFVFYETLCFFSDFLIFFMIFFLMIFYFFVIYEKTCFFMRNIYDCIYDF